MLILMTVTMSDEFDKELFDLLMKYFGEDWNHEWTAEDGGFNLKLYVWGQDGECSNDGELGQTVNLVALPE